MTAYIISYFVVGLLLAVGAWLNGTFAREKALFAGAMTLLLWPLVAIAAPESYFRGSRSETKDKLKSSLGALLEASEDLPLTADEAARLKRVAEAGDFGVGYVGFFRDCGEVLEAFWNLDIPPSVYFELKSARRALRDREPDSGIRFSIEPPDWYVGFSNEFVKSVSKVDARTQSRVLKAIQRIGDAPTTTMGNTIRPLTGDLAGLWRCRIGDDRLIYFPDASCKHITLICFGPRGKVYEKVPDTQSLTDD